MAVATNERENFVVAVLKKKEGMLRELLKQGEVPLRDGEHSLAFAEYSRIVQLCLVCKSMNISRSAVFHGSVAECKISQC